MLALPASGMRAHQLDLQVRSSTHSCVPTNQNPARPFLEESCLQKKTAAGNMQYFYLRLCRCLCLHPPPLRAYLVFVLILSGELQSWSALINGRCSPRANATAVFHVDGAGFHGTQQRGLCIQAPV